MELELDNVTVAYDDEPVLHDISLEIKEGEKVVIFGQSGSGKSTLLKKLLEMQDGRASYIHQDYALVPQLTAYHNVYAGLLDRRNTLRNVLNLIRPDRDEVERVRSILTDLGLAEKLFDRVSDLSGGQQQRVAVARAIYRGSELVLADEPVSSVDPRQSGEILRLLGRSAKTLVVALHDVSLGFEHFERVIGLRDGRMAFDLPTDQVSRETLADLYKPC